MSKKITQEQVDKIIERLTERVEKANQVFLKKIGKSIDEISRLTPTNAYQLVQILKYGGDYEKMVKEIEKYTRLNIQDIDKIFSEYAKKDQQFYEQFYKYRDISYIEYDKNLYIKNQTQALANIVKNEMFNYTRDNILGYTISDEKGRLIFTGLRETYNKVLDLAMMNADQGKETFNESMSNILTELGTSGIKTINYQSGRSVRLDSTVRMHLKSRLQELHNENQKIYGAEFDADGIEISVHANPAIDHEDVQGRQFSKAEFDRLMSGLDAIDYKGNTYTLDHDGNGSYRPISELNCYHYIFSIVLGVSEPEYSDDELRLIKESNDKGFEFEGKHYTNYEGTQLQRSIERKIREQKDIQILAKESGNKPLLEKSQRKIDTLTRKYRELSNVSGLSTRMERLKVNGYRKVKVDSKQKPLSEGRLEKLIYNSKEIDQEEFIRLKEINKQNIDKKTWETIYNGNWESTSELNEFGYVNSHHAKYINKYVRSKHSINDLDVIGLSREVGKEVDYDKSSLLGEYDKTISALHTAISKNELPYDMKLHRYLDLNWLGSKANGETSFEELLENIKGKEIIERNFISASATKASVYSDRDIDMILYAEKGTNAFMTDNIMESEVIFDESILEILDYKIKDDKIKLYAWLKK